MTTYDFAIVGAGIAGASLAAELAEGGARVLLLEAEDRPGYHSTGRSAAFWEECYGGPEIVPLTLASGEYLRDNGFLHQRGALYIGRQEDAGALDRFMERFGNTGATIERLHRETLAEKVLGLREDWTEAVWEPACADIDVAGLHAHFLARARKAGVDLECRALVDSLSRKDGHWTIKTAAGGTYKASWVVNAAGAWADSLAQLAGARPLGIGPLRRTVVQLRIDPVVPADQPLVLDISGQFYFKPEAGRLWLSPHDEIPSEPCDAAPEEIDVATAIDRFQQVVDCRIEAVERRWAGLRSFSPDRLPVYGRDPQVEGFAWFAGQGGYGIQTSPAAARLAAQLLLGAGRDAMTEKLDASLYDPARFA
ncbi:NAD(P)/FAD-dependent oxidoreductase [Qipengyuania aquimaris]|uniref:NAD(P)/FAD-dependent oxidoreductase n=1 Tax=Qipengyuania aquimaris TaxID=255984 RepID=UPI001FD18EB3|nr:FAD-dependent oxidoreductase [Qipengyuania aquimaris]UOR14219.1 FAD-binding oxidoreductase [Qipengyuania aquimaris]